jgi:hypothetical protein
MHHLRLIKSLSYSGAVSATKDHPDVFVDNENRYKRAMESGYFEEITDAGSKDEEPENSQEDPDDDFQGEETDAHVDSLSDMSVTELKAYASLNGIDISGLKKKEEILEAIKTAEKKADEARAALRSE